MPANTELDALGWIFLLASTLSMTVLTIWCFYRVLKLPPDEPPPEPPAGLGP